jgi:Flp pilus assembly protein TadD
VPIDPSDRLAYFATLARESPSEARARFGYANELLRAERYSEAAGELRAYLDLAEDEGNAWGRLAEALTALDRPDEAADAYLAGIDQAIKHGHTGMAEDFQHALEAL